MGTATTADIDLSNLQQANSKLKLHWRELADICGVNESTLSRWRGGESVPRAIARTRLIQLGELLELLRRAFNGPDLARQWLRDSKPNSFGGKATPLDVMREGRIDRVLALLEFLLRGG
jgi:transcriptional regulator with XRE-family HTH domain